MESARIALELLDRIAVVEEAMKPLHPLLRDVDKFAQLPAAILQLEETVNDLKECHQEYLEDRQEQRYLKGAIRRLT